MVLFRTADKTWSPRRAADLERERPFDPLEYARTYDSVVEVVDPRSGKVVASHGSIRCLRCTRRGTSSLRTTTTIPIRKVGFVDRATDELIGATEALAKDVARSAGPLPSER